MNAELMNQAIKAGFSSLDGCRLLAGEVMDCVDDLFAQERESVTQAMERRRHEFATGRMLARKLMVAAGIRPGPVLRGRHREPLWPEGVTGSLSHTGELAIAALAAADRCRALGVDLEVADRVGSQLYPKLFTAEEQGLIDGDSARAGLVFSAKEAAYKATFALAPRFIGFQEAQIVLDASERRFRFRYRGSHAPSRVMEEGQGHFLFCERYVLSLFIID